MAKTYWTFEAGVYDLFAEDVFYAALHEVLWAVHCTMRAAFFPESAPPEDRGVYDPRLVLEEYAPTIDIDRFMSEYERARNQERGQKQQKKEKKKKPRGFMIEVAEDSSEYIGASIHQVGDFDPPLRFLGIAGYKPFVGETGETEYSQTGSALVFDVQYLPDLIAALQGLQDEIEKTPAEG